MTIYKMFDWGDADATYGAYGFDRWERLNPAQGEYNWSIIDAWLDKNAGKPCAFSIATHLSAMEGWPSFYDATPTWVYDGMGRPTMNGRPVGKIVTANGVDAALPYYNDQNRWWSALHEFTLAFGARYDHDERLSAVFFGPGLDMETQPSKAPYGDGNQGYRFGQLCSEYPKWYKAAFPNKPIFYACAPGQGRLELAKLCGSLGIGVKHNGLQQDMDSWDGYGAFVGSWDYMQWAMDNDVPRWVESAHWLSDENMYWSIPAALHYHPVGVDLHSGWIEAMPAEQLKFLSDHVGVTAQTAPDAFVVLRDSEYPKRAWTGSDGKAYGCSGHVGDWNFYLKRTSPDADAPRFEDIGPSDAPESRQCRLIESATFEIELAAEPPYDVAIRWLDEPGHWLSLDGGATMLAGTGSGLWDTLDVTVEDRRFTITGDGAAVHMVRAVPVDGGGEPPEPPVDPVDWDAMLAQIAVASDALERCYAELGEATEHINAAEQQRLAASEAVIALKAMIEAEQ